ncbi:MAG: hypothetical protein ACPGOV_14345 [Magnetovibrionaceae bacterium]
MITFFKPPQALPFALLALLFGWMAFQPAPEALAERLSSSWEGFVENARAQASDHNKASDCLTGGTLESRH